MNANAATGPALLPRMHLFGRFSLSQAGTETALPGRKARGILAYLALSPGHCATREQLADLLWTDRGPEQARASLRQALKELRELPALATAIETTRGEVALNAAAIAIDLHEIRDAAAARDLPALARLLERARGDLLEDFLDVAPAFDEWLLAERPRQRDRLLGDALDAIEADGLANMKDARTILRSLDRLDPVNEALIRLGMRLDHAIGDAASLHRRYRQLCDLLESEFDALPSEETRALFHSLAGNREQARAPPAAAAPAVDPPRVVTGGDLVPLVMVAPLQATPGDAALGSLAEFCADDIRVSLSRMRGIHVLSVGHDDLAAMMQQGDEALGLYLLSGSLRQITGDYRVSIQLANAASRIILWSESLRFEQADEQMLDAIVGKAAGAVLPAIDRDLHERLEASGDLDDERAMYTRARLMIRNGRQLPAVLEGVGLLERIIDANPRHFGARMVLFRIYSTHYWQQIAGHDFRAFRATAEKHLQAAAAIEPASYAVRIGQAWGHLRNGDVATAQRELDVLVARLPHDAEATNMCAMGYFHLGLLDQAERLMQRAFFLNPFPPSDYHADYALPLALKGEHERAEEHFAVSGETGLLYSAARLANAAHLAGGEDRIAAVARRFAADFRAAWQPATEPALPDVLEWIGYALPLQPQRNLEWVKSGLQRMLEPSWPAAPGSGS